MTEAGETQESATSLVHIQDLAVKGGYMQCNSSASLIFLFLCVCDCEHLPKAYFIYSNWLFRKEVRKGWGE